jgi:hypothetical protein
MLTVIDLVQFRHYWKSFAHTPHCDFSLAARGDASSVFHSSPHYRRRNFTLLLI